MDSADHTAVAVIGLTTVGWITVLALMARDWWLSRPVATVYGCRVYVRGDRREVDVDELGDAIVEAVRACASGLGRPWDECADALDEASLTLHRDVLVYPGGKARGLAYPGEVHVWWPPSAELEDIAPTLRHEVGHLILFALCIADDEHHTVLAGVGL